MTTLAYRILVTILMIAVCGAASHMRSGVSTEQQALLGVDMTVATRTRSQAKGVKDEIMPNFAKVVKPNKKFVLWSDGSTNCKNWNPSSCSACVEKTNSLGVSPELHGCVWCYNEEDVVYGQAGDGACRETKDGCADTEEFFRSISDTGRSDRTRTVNEDTMELLGQTSDQWYTTFHRIQAKNPMDVCGEAEIRQITLSTKEEELVLGLSEKLYQEFWTESRKGKRVRTEQRKKMDNVRPNQYLELSQWGGINVDNHYSTQRLEELEDAKEKKAKEDEAEKKAKDDRDAAEKKVEDDRKEKAEKKAKEDREAEEKAKEDREEEEKAEDDRKEKAEKKAKEDRDAEDKAAKDKEAEVEAALAKESEENEIVAATDAPSDAPIDALVVETAEEKASKFEQPDFGGKIINSCTKFKENTDACCQSMNNPVMESRFICKMTRKTITIEGAQLTKICSPFGNTLSGDRTNLCPENMGNIEESVWLTRAETQNEEKLQWAKKKNEQ